MKTQDSNNPPNNTLQSKNALCSAIMIGLSQCLNAATITVNDTDCNLSDAISAANTNTPVNGCIGGELDERDIIELPADTVITLRGALPVIVSQITINGNNATIARDKTSYGSFPILRVNASTSGFGNLFINNTTITGGNNYGSSNYGGGISVFNGQLTMDNCTVSNNVGGGILLRNSTGSTIDNSIISNNTTGVNTYYNGGGIAVLGSSYVRIRNTTVINNSSEASTAGGAGIYLRGINRPTQVNIYNSTIANNASLRNGGGITLRGDSTSTTANLINSTISNNTTEGNGGGVFIGGLSSVGIFSSTLVRNSAEGSGGGIFSETTYSVGLHQSIVSGNFSKKNGREIFSNSIYSFFLNDYNLLGFNSDPGISILIPGKTDMVPTELTPDQIFDIELANNGGITLTHALVNGSPAVDAIAESECSQNRDQTGFDRPADGDNDTIARCDIGSVEKPTDIIFANSFED